MGFAGTGLRGRTEADHRAAVDKRRTAVGNLRGFDPLEDLFRIVGVFDFERAPAVGFKAFGDIFGEGDSGGAFDADAVVVIEKNEIVELEVSGKGSGLVRDAFHHAAVAGDDVDFAVQQPRFVESGHCGEVLGGRGHADSGSETGSERSGRNLYAFGVPVFRMSRSETFPLTEVLEIIHGQTVSEEMKQTVDEHRTVPGGKDEAVASEPVRVPGVVLEEFIPEGEGEIRRSHRHARVARFCLLHAVRRKQTDRVRRELQRFQIRHFRSFNCFSVCFFEKLKYTLTCNIHQESRI